MLSHPYLSAFIVICIYLAYYQGRRVGRIEGVRDGARIREIFEK